MVDAFQRRGTMVRRQKVLPFFAGLGRLLGATALPIAMSAPALASPVEVMECTIIFTEPPIPWEQVENRFTIRRHVVQTQPISALETEYWAQAKYEDNGYFELTVYPFEGEPVTERSASTYTEIQDGFGQLGDIYVDEAPTMEHTYIVDGWTLDSLVVVLRREDGTALDTHLEVPDQLDRTEWDSCANNSCGRECSVVWTVPGGGVPCADPGGGQALCTHGAHVGRITSITYEQHEADHAGPFVINAGLNDAWVSDGAPFQGLFITVYPELGLVFVAWFTFDTEVPVENSAVFGWGGQRWVTAVGPFTGNTASLTAELTTGGIFNSSAPLPTQDDEHGTVDLDFDGCGQGTVTFNFPSVGLSGSYPIHRAVEGNTALCETLAQP